MSEPGASPRLTITIPDLHAGALDRRTVRYALRAAQVLGAEVHVAERRRLFESWFAIRAIGSAAELEPLLRLVKAARWREPRDAAQ
jgi:hypothetical protein